LVAFFMHYANFNVLRACASCCLECALFPASACEVYFIDRTIIAKMAKDNKSLSVKA